MFAQMVMIKYWNLIKYLINRLFIESLKNEVEETLDCE